MTSLLASLLSEDPRKQTAWNKAHIVPGYDPRHVRRDDFGNFIQWDQHGNRNSNTGWEIDHRRPTLLGGADTLDNLRALHWRANASLGGSLGGARR
jgi:5-methylcytosine-specific restriction endonuclease McrA